MNRQEQAAALEKDWAENPRWKNVKRGYTAEDVVRLRGSLQPEYTLARRGAEKLWDLVNGDAKKGYVNCMGALTGGQAMQQAKAGIEAIYLSGWQVAADANTSETMYPDQSLYAYDSVPTIVRRINSTFKRADEIQWSRDVNPEDEGFIDYFLPIVADAEAGFGGVLNAYELMKNMIANGASGVHFEDQLAAAKKCGHMGGKVLVPTQEAVQKLISARLASDVMGVPTLLLARTDAEAANLLTSDVDENDKPFCTGERTAEGFFRVKNGLEQAISRGLAYAPYADLVWCETGTPDIGFAREFAEALKAQNPEQLLAYNCSPSFNWKKNLSDSQIASFQEELSDLGYKYQFITLAGIHNMWYNMFDLAYDYARGEGMKHYVEKVQEPEFAAAEKGYSFVAHQQEVGAGYFDDVTTVIQGGQSSVTALTGSTEEDQF
ncbi:isocitrate lyase [Solemya velum gill symbiont]|uniref:Isocitrate lyase n=1 Tax=Solemya velum gill symbiont TaxID=2340 RepID=A0A0B0H9Z8_SOVGS|nr:isocitrate lyase [Solemya velum gill symbiont]KHF25487.1 isocitrate lyase [Solemya velum gill symbiont]OOY35321.1 isocitrate lyase [Solemya velum gill symbiont]OOY38088.1 isocitrate lyase [Solemya velum gill symbiont]OOY41049.1 isocitrate lyase [Solemya velum gill symbiont]OOY43629.1 isocitrate lyase [Solemya velum gill symbiont]